MSRSSGNASEKIRRVKIRGLPSWMSPEVRKALLEAFRGKEHAEKEADRRKVRITSEFSKGERRVMRYSPPMPISEWAEKYRVVETGSIRGRWRNLFTPYLVGIMDAMNMPCVETGILCKSPQTGGSEAGHNIVGYCIDRLPGDVMYVFPDEITARENARDRIIPMLMDTPRLRGYMTGTSDDASSLRIKLMHMVIYLGWSGSVSRLGNKPIRTLILDEMDKYKDVKNEATSEDLAEKRTITWKHRKKIFKISTPTIESGNIWRAFSTEANARFYYWVKCPHCGEFQLMKLENIGWPEKNTEKEPPFEEVYSKRMAYYVCEKCGSCWNDADRDKAVRAGEWREEKTGMNMYAYVQQFKPVKVGWHLPAWLSYFISLSDVASKYLKWKQSGDVAAMKDLRNNYEALPWAEEYEERDENEILRLCDDRPRGAVPGPLPESPDVPRVAALIAGVDTQKGYFRYVLRAFGFGESEESWLVQCGALASFRDLEDVLLKRVYRDSSGNEYRVSGIMIDAMGNRTREVYAWAAAHKGQVFPWQGRQHMSSPYSMTAIEYFPGVMGNKVKIKGGLTLFACDTTFFKSGLANKLSVAPEDPGAFHLHTGEGGILDQYAKEMVAEIWDDEKMAWVNPMNRANHYWDCEVMASALAYIKGVKNIPLPSAEGEQEKKVMPVRTSFRSGTRKFGRY